MVITSVTGRIIMSDEEMSAASVPRQTPWNKGKLTGAKPPLKPRHVWSIRSKLQLDRRTRDLAMFNLAIDSKLRGCDVVALKVEDVAPNGYAADRATIRQKKTGQPVRFELTEQTRLAVDEYLRATGKKPGEFLFTGRHSSKRGMRRGNTLVSSPSGLPASASTHTSSGPTPCVGPRRP
jgi:integrase